MKRLYACILLLFAASLTFAQTIMVKAPNIVGPEEQFSIAFVIDSESAPSSFNWNVPEDFQLVWGPQKGTSTSVSYVNGKMSKSSQTTYSYVLMPKRSGSFAMPAAEAVVKGKTVYSKSVTIEVVGDSSSSSQDPFQQASPSSSAAASESQQTARTSREDIYMRMLVSKSNAVVGETLTATLKLYQRVNIAGFEDAKFPSFEGFWSQETEAPTNIEFRRENVGGEIYNVAVIRSWSLVPQRAGSLEISPSELVCQINVRAPRASTGSIFDDFFQDDYRTVRKRLSTPAITVRVASLPAGAPASFGGGVGEFRMDVTATKDSLQAHDAASLKLTVTGRGNLALIEAPKINFPPDFEQYDVKTTDIPNGKVFEYPFIPRSNGNFVLGPVEYSYYDVGSRKYVTLRSKEIPIKVSRGSESDNFGGQQVAAPVGKKDIRSLGNDIRFIVTRVPSFREEGSFFAGSALFWVLVALLLLVAGAVWYGTEKLESKKADVVGSKRSAATKMARKRLSSAGLFLQKNLYSAFYEELHRTLLGYVSDKLNMDMSDMSKENIAVKLAESGAPEALCKEYVDLLDACEFARYSPSAGQDAMNEHYEKAVNVVSLIDSSMKKSNKSPLKAVALLLCAGLSLSSLAAEPADSLWTAGVDAYSAEQWDQAADAWNQILSEGQESAELYYNIGNAYFKTQQYARAIVSYKKALRLNPSFKDAAFNLEYAQSKCLDKVESVPEFFLKSWMRKLGAVCSSDSWAVIFLVLFALALSCGLLFVLSRSSVTRKFGFFLGIALIVLSFASAGFAFSQKRICTDRDEAVVLLPVSSVKSSPGNSSTDLFVLHEGTSLSVIETVGEWSNVALSDGRQGWIRTSDIVIL